MDRYKNKYRIASARAQWWNYGWSGAYFITICTRQRESFFGKIILNQIIASKSGQLAERFWYEIPNQFPYVELAEFVIMPNHIHGILLLDKPIAGINNVNAEENANQHVETRLIASLQQSQSRDPYPGKKQEILKEKNTKQNTEYASHPKIKQTQNGGFAGNINPMLNDNISRIIRWYKGRCSFEIRKMNVDFAWQPRFYDRIIRNDKEYKRISDYIITNPANWVDDKFYPHENNHKKYI